MRLERLLPALLAVVFLAGCANPLPGNGPAALSQVRVAAASDLKFAFDELLVAFHDDHPDVSVVPSYGSSGNFFAQIANGAPFDLFLSADINFPKRLIEQGVGVAESEFVYGVGRVVLWVPNSSDVDVESLGMDAVRDPSIRKLAIANPQHAPYGQAAEAALRLYGVYDEVAGRLILGENIAQTAQFVESGGADMGVIALSLALAPALVDAGRYWEIPEDAHPRLEQGGVIPRQAANPEEARLLRDYLTGTEGRALLERYGFVVPDGRNG